MDYALVKLRRELESLARQSAESAVALRTDLTALLTRLETLERQVAVETKARLDRETAEKAERERLQQEADEKAAAEKAAAEKAAAKASKGLFAVKPKPAKT